MTDREFLVRFDAHIERMDAHIERMDARMERLDEHMERGNEHMERGNLYMREFHIRNEKVLRDCTAQLAGLGERMDDLGQQTRANTAAVLSVLDRLN